MSIYTNHDQVIYININISCVAMATKESVLESVVKDSFLTQVETARGRLRESVSELRVSLQQREEELCVELDRLEREHTSRVSGYRDRMASLTAIQSGIEEQFKHGEFEDLKKSFLSETDKKIEELEREYPPRSVEFVCEEGLVEKVKGMGKIVVRVEESEKCEMREKVADSEIEIDTDAKGSTEELNVEVKTDGSAEECVEKPLTIGTDDGAIDYSLRTKPVTTLAFPQIYCQYPQGIAYDEKDNSVYFTALGTNLFQLLLSNNKVTTFDITGIQLYNKLLNSKYPTSTQPFGIAVSNGIYISGITVTSDELESVQVVASASIEYDRRSRSNKLKLGYTVLYGKKVLGGEHNPPTGIAVHSDLVYVCDTKSDLVRVFSLGNHYSIVRTITDPDLYLPLDVKVHEKRIFVLNSKPPYVLEFDLTGFRRDAFLSHSILSDFVPSFLCVDRAGRFLISDRRRPYVYVLRREKSMRAAVEARLELNHGEDPLVEPRGVCLDGEGRVLVLCNYKEAMLQIF